MTYCAKCGEAVFGNRVRTKQNRLGKLEVRHMICPRRRGHKKAERQPKPGRLSRADWKKRRTECFARDGFKCFRCRSEFFLDAHHIIKRSQGGTDDLENLITLCRSCHDEAHPEKRVLFGEGREQAIKDFNTLHDTGETK